MHQVRRSLPSSRLPRRKNRRRIVLRNRGWERRRDRASDVPRDFYTIIEARAALPCERGKQRKREREKERASRSREREISPTRENSISTRCNFREAEKAMRAVTCSRNGVCCVDARKIWDPSLEKRSPRADAGDAASTRSVWGALWNFKFRYYEWGIYGLFRALEILPTWILWRNSRLEVEPS